jgi:hypothetical protein
MDFSTNKKPKGDNNAEFDDNFNDFEFNDEDFEFDSEVKKYNDNNDYKIVSSDSKEEKDVEYLEENDQVESYQQVNNKNTEVTNHDVNYVNNIDTNSSNKEEQPSTSSISNIKTEKKRLLIKSDFYDENIANSLLEKSKSTKHCSTNSKVKYLPQSTKNQSNNRRNSLHAKSTPSKTPILQISSPFGKKKMSSDYNRNEVTCQDIEFLDNNYWKAHHIVTDEVDFLINELRSQGENSENKFLIKEDHFSFVEDSKL